MMPTVSKKSMAFIIVIFCFLARTFPHIPNALPLIVATFISGSALNRHTAIISTLAAVLFSNIALSTIYGYPIFGYWLLFMVSGFLGATLLGSIFPANSPFIKQFSAITVIVFGYWAWTNFGTWLVTDMYTQSFSGLLTCYTAALPFLKSSLIANVIGYIIIYQLMQSRLTHQNKVLV